MFSCLHAEHEVSFFTISNFWYKGRVDAELRSLFIILCGLFLNGNDLHFSSNAFSEQKNLFGNLFAEQIIIFVWQFIC